LRLRPVVLVLWMEASAPRADVGRVLCVGIKRFGMGQINLSIASRSSEERRVLSHTLERIGVSHVYMAWRASDFVAPFLAMRALRHGLDPSPLYEPLMVDLSEIMHRYLRISAETLQEACKALRVGMRGTAAGGKGRPTMRLIGDRCRSNTLASERLAKRLMPLIRVAHRELPSLL